MIEGIRPEDLGLDGRRWPEFRAIQLEAIEQVLESEARFDALMLPTGSGKSVLAAALHKITGKRTVVLTSTKGLQDQYINSFGGCGLVDVRGRNNYWCRKFNTATCKDGARVGCHYPKARGCPATEARVRACNGEFVVTNYALWFAVNQHGGGLCRNADEIEDYGPNPVEMLVLDEAHLADQEVGNAVGCQIWDRELVELAGVEDAPGWGDNLGVWNEKAQEIWLEAGVQLENLNRLIKEKGNGAGRSMFIQASRLEQLVEKADKLRNLDPNDGEWVVEGMQSPKMGEGWKFDVIWPGRWAESRLFRGIEKVILMSATLRPKTMALLGVGREEFKFREWRRIFPPQNGPIYHLPPMKAGEGGPVMINLNRRTKEEDYEVWLDLIDDFIDEWKDYKGIIHSTSYERQNRIMSRSRHRHLMIGNTSDPDSATAAEIFGKFQKMAAPAILVSPSFGTGWDFEGDRARWQIIAKVPFPPMQGKVMKARLERDKSYGDYIAMQSLLQAAGRVQRDFDDWGATVIMDGALSFFMVKSGALGPTWFKQSIKKVYQVPRRIVKAGKAIKVSKAG